MAGGTPVLGAGGSGDPAAGADEADWRGSLRSDLRRPEPTIPLPRAMALRSSLTGRKRKFADATLAQDE